MVIRWRSQASNSCTAGCMILRNPAVTWQREFCERYDPASWPPVVIGIDERTYRTPFFSYSPTVTRTREIGRVLAGGVDGGARVVGFGTMVPRSIEQSEIPFGEDTLGVRLR